MRINRICQHHWNSHRRGNDHIRNPAIPGLHQIRGSHQHFAVMPFNDYPLHSFLDFRTEVRAIRRINSPVHKTKAVCWTDDGVTGYAEDGPVVDFDEIQVTTETLPRRC